MAIGFEFATNINVGPAMAGAVFPKAARLSRGSGWEMVVDGDDVEFVVKQVEPTDLGRDTLALNLDLLTYKSGSQPIGCIPQVTAGIRLGRLRKLMRIMADPTTEVAGQFLGGTGDAAKGFYSGRLGRAALDHRRIRDPRWSDHAPSDKLRGLVSLLLLYLMQGDAANSVGAVKYVTCVMSRTKFSALFDTLPAEERDHYRAQPSDWVELLCSTLMQEATGNAVDPQGKVIGQLVTDGMKLTGADRAAIPVRRRDWLVGMTKGQDLLSAEAHPIEGKGRTRRNVLIYKDSNPGLGHRLRGLAALGDKMDDITYKTYTERGAILEFRARQKEVLIGDWKQFALDAFAFFRQVNEGDRHLAVDLGDAEDA
jgi:hypothetical protein